MQNLTGGCANTPLYQTPPLMTYRRASGPPRTRTQRRCAGGYRSEEKTQRLEQTPYFGGASGLQASRGRKVHSCGAPRIRGILIFTHTHTHIVAILRARRLLRPCLHCSLFILCSRRPPPDPPGAGRSPSGERARRELRCPPLSPLTVRRAPIPRTSAGPKKWARLLDSATNACSTEDASDQLSVWKPTAIVGRHYLSNATCLIRPHLFYECFVV